MRHTVEHLTGDDRQMGSNILWSSCILTPLHSLTGPEGQQFASPRGGAVCPGDAPTLLELGFWWPHRDPWSPASIGPLTSATGCFSHPSCPSSVFTAGHRLMRHTARILKGPDLLLGALWSSCFLTPLQSLTGPVGQPFASRLGGAVVQFLGKHPHFWN